MECICDLRGFTGDRKNLVCVLDIENSRVFWPDEDGPVYLRDLFHGNILAVYRKEEQK